VEWAKVYFEDVPKISNTCKHFL